jgi:hypothetical protein
MMMKSSRFIVWLLLMLLLTSCNAPFTEQELRHAYQQWVDRLFADDGLPQDASPGQPRQPAADVIDHTMATSLAMTPVVQVNPDICNLAVSGMPIDITIPDGTRMRPGQTFSKTWRLVNGGGCAWGQGYSAVWFSGELLSATRIQFLRSVIPPGQPVDITIEMVAPENAGVYQSNWMLSDPNSNLFGIGPKGDAPFWVLIEVVEEAGPPAAAASPTPIEVLEIHHQGEVSLQPGDSVDMDSGEINAGEQDDISFELSNEGVLMLAAQGSARMLHMGVQQPTDRDCRAQNLSADAITLDTLAVNDYVCYRTNQALPGYFRLVESRPDEPRLLLEFVTWAVP